MSRPPTSRVEIVLQAGHTQDITSLVISRGDEDRFVVSSGDDGVVKLWDMKSGRLVRNVARIDPNNYRPVTGCVFCQTFRRNHDVEQRHVLTVREGLRFRSLSDHSDLLAIGSAELSHHYVHYGVANVF